jgi:hypothetical protein
MKQHFDFLGNELFDGDEVITIKKNGRADGGDLVKTKVKIDENGKLSFAEYNYGFYSSNIGSKCYKVVK